MTSKPRATEPEKLKQTPPPADQTWPSLAPETTAPSADVSTSSDDAPPKPKVDEPAESDLYAPTGYTTHEPVPGSDGPRSQLELDQQ